MAFEEDRRKLYNEFLKEKELGKIEEKTKRDFWKFLEGVIISLYDRENSFFGQFLIQVKRDIKLDIRWPIGTKVTGNGFTMYFNPIAFLECEKKDMQGLLKHEVYHIMMKHYERSIFLKNKYSKEAISVAMDISINQYIKNLPPYSKKLEGVNHEYNLNLSQDMTMEQYAKKIQEAIDYRKLRSVSKDDKNNENNVIDQEKAHDIWEEATLSLDLINENIKKIAINSSKKESPKHIKKIIELMVEKPKLKWSDILKRMIPSAKSGYKKTTTRLDRRFPDRLDLRGKLPKRSPKILIAIDISASMSDKDMENILIEILDIAKNKSCEISVIECDNEVRRFYKLNGIKDIKPRSKKNGSTKFSPVFRYIKDNNMRDYILIYFTDGVGEKSLEVSPINNKTLWVLTGNTDLSLEKPYGTVVKLEREKKEIYGATYGLEELRDSIHDWPR
ncbi:MAG: VWA-like domain-containing protein [Clostridium perfringens]|nr:VWA-like domain-containing protein [Clostridium perfringens]